MWTEGLQKVFYGLQTYKSNFLWTENDLKGSKTSKHLKGLKWTTYKRTKDLQKIFCRPKTILRLLRIQYLQEVSYWSNTFKRSSKDWKPLKGLQWIKEKGHLGIEDLKFTFMNQRPLKGFLWTEDLQKVFQWSRIYGPKTSKRSPKVWNLLENYLWTENVLRVSVDRTL